MWEFTLSPGQSIKIGKNIIVRAYRRQNENTAKIIIEAPREVIIKRAELVGVPTPSKEDSDASDHRSE